jgi:hypothetical protein
MAFEALKELQSLQELEQELYCCSVVHSFLHPSNDFQNFVLNLKISAGNAVIMLSIITISSNSMLLSK